MKQQQSKQFEGKRLVGSCSESNASEANLLCKV
jgi:hypothetical protein